MHWLAPVVLAALVMGCGPIVMIPGGALDGAVATTPDDWSFTDGVDTVQLETRPDDPYSVNIWCVSTPRGLMVGGSSDSGWVVNAKADRRVRLRIGGAIYELQANATEAKADRDAFVTAAGAKYDFEMDPADEAGSTLFVLTPR